MVKRKKGWKGSTMGGPASQTEAQKRRSRYRFKVVELHAHRDKFKVHRVQVTFTNGLLCFDQQLLLVQPRKIADHVLRQKLRTPAPSPRPLRSSSLSNNNCRCFGERKSKYRYTHIYIHTYLYTNIYTHILCHAFKPCVNCLKRFIQSASNSSFRFLM